VSDLVRGNKLLRSGKLEEAVAAYQSAIAHNPNFHWSHYKLGEALEKLGRWEDAIANYKTAIKINPNSAQFQSSLEFAMEARLTNDNIINLNPNTAEKSTENKMYKLLVDFNGFINIAEYSSTELEPCIVIERIQDPFGVEKYVTIFRKPGYSPFHIEKASKNFNNQEFVLFWVCLNNGTFLQWNIDAKGNYIEQSIIRDKSAIRKLFSHLTFTNFPGYAKVLNTLQEDLLKNSGLDYSFMNALNAILFDHKNDKDIAEDISIVEYFCTHPDLHNSTNYIDLGDLHRAIDYLGDEIPSSIGNVNTYKEIQEKGDLVYFESNQNQMIENQISDFQTIENLLTSESSRGTFYREWNFLHYANNIKYSVIRLLTGYAWCKCPFTGEILKSNKSIPVAETLYIAYYFESLYPFFMLSYGGWCSQINAIYLPISNVCIRLNSLWEWGDLKITIKILINIFNNDEHLISSYLKNSVKNNCLIIDCKNNLGHYIWQDLSGLGLLFDETNLYQHIQSCLINPDSKYKKHQFNPENIFPELKNFHCISGEGNMTEITLRQNLFVFKIEDVIISKFIPSRIQSISSKNFGILDLLSAEKKAGSKILMINLRSHNKIWVNAVEVLSEIFNDFNNSENSKLQKLIVLYDGFEDIKPKINLIKEKVSNPQITHIDCTGFSLIETCAIVEMIDAFINTIGSGLVIPTWIYNKPGIAHGDPGHLTQKTLWKYAAPKGYDSDAVIWLEESEINCLEGEKFYGNYTISADVIIPKIKNILDIS
jgi:tetratricopeptide (TPR) repeat protein